jgi:hypothetical protein
MCGAPGVFFEKLAAWVMPFLPCLCVDLREAVYQLDLDGKCRLHCTLLRSCPCHSGMSCQAHYWLLTYQSCQAVRVDCSIASQQQIPECVCWSTLIGSQEISCCQLRPHHMYLVPCLQLECKVEGGEPCASSSMWMTCAMTGWVL